MAITYLGSSGVQNTSITVSESVAAGDTILVAISGITGAPTDNAPGGSNTYVAMNTALSSTFSVYGCQSTKATAAGNLIITPPIGNLPGAAIAAYSLYETTPWGNVIAYQVVSGSGTQGPLTGTWTGGVTDSWEFPAAGFTAAPPSGIVGQIVSASGW